ncbi:hypothetical protein D3C76_1682440 [compost metagenome]
MQLGLMEGDCLAAQEFYPVDALQGALQRHQVYTRAQVQQQGTWLPLIDRA